MIANLTTSVEWETPELRVSEATGEFYCEVEQNGVYPDETYISLCTLCTLRVGSFTFDRAQLCALLGERQVCELEEWTATNTHVSEIA